MRKRPSLARMMLATATALALTAPGALGQESNPPAPPTNLVAADHPLDGGQRVDLTWNASPDADSLEAYWIYKAIAQVGDAVVDDEHIEWEYVDLVAKDQTSFVVRDLERSLPVKDLKKEGDHIVNVGDLMWNAGASHWNDYREFPMTYRFRVKAIGAGGVASQPAESNTVVPRRQWFDGDRLWLAVITLILAGSVFYFISQARSGKVLKVRRIAGLEAVDEAVGRATEMGRSCLYIAGTQDMNDIQTIAGITVLSHVAKTAAEYDAKVEMPCSRSLVMTTARETVQAAYLSAGRPDAYNQDLIYYVTDEQFGFVAYLQGHITREKPAACFYMGAFYAESLILAETGNNVGAIQVAGTAMPAQLPFFVAACDYTLIGEEFFAASAYLSGEPDQLGSLKGQDVGKVIVAIGIIIGVTAATIGVAIAGPDTFDSIAAYIKDVVLV
jgi:Domain of unknown function (DUF6754)